MIKLVINDPARTDEELLEYARLYAESQSEIKKYTSE
jgi:hypothetical protein